MERKNSQRLSAMEKTQAETNKRLENMQSMLQSVLSTICRTDIGGKETVPPTGSTAVGETSEPARDLSNRGTRRSSGLGSSEEWWDILCQTSEDEGRQIDKGEENGIPNNLHEQVTLYNSLSVCDWS